MHDAFIVKYQHIPPTSTSTSLRQFAVSGDGGDGGDESQKDLSSSAAFISTASSSSSSSSSSGSPLPVSPRKPSQRHLPLHTDQSTHRLPSTHPINTTIDTPYQHTLSTQLSTHPINTPSLHILSTHPFSLPHHY